MKIIRTPDEMSQYSLGLLSMGVRIGLVPTMGYLHKGHLSLVGLLDGECDVKAASIFVNPIQFGKNEDLDKYPRNVERDLELLESKGCELVFMPDAEDMYPDGFETFVDVENLSKPLCGRFRPGHFRGVATIVLRLFNITHCAVAAFGLKDFQQAMVIRRMVTDLNLSVKLLFGETVREPDGLALSSRNVYLSPEERKTALAVPRALDWARGEAAKGETDAALILKGIERIILDEGNIHIQYIEIFDPETLEPRLKLEDRNQVALAVQVGATRLIDNIFISGKIPAKPIEGIR